MNVLFLVADDLNSWLLEDSDRYAGKVVAPNLRKFGCQWCQLHSGLHRRAGLFAFSHRVLFRCSPVEIGYLQQRADHQHK